MSSFRSRIVDSTDDRTARRENGALTDVDQGSSFGHAKGLRRHANLSRSHRSRSQSTCVGRTHRTQFTSTPTCGGWTFSREFWLAEIGGGGGDLGSCAIRPTTGWSRLSASRAGCTLATKVPLTCAPLSLCNCPLDETDVSRYPRRDTQRRRAGRFRFTRRRGRPP